MSALEGGQATDSTIRTIQGSAREAGVDAKVAKGSIGGSRETEESRSYTDTSEAQFNRLLTALENEPEELAYVPVTQPDVDFDGIGIGSMVSWECEIYIPDIIQAMSSKGEFVEALQLMKDLRPMAKQFGAAMDDLPDEDQMDSASHFISKLGAQLLIVGDDVETDWQVAGRIQGEHLLGDMDGVARVVGKVSKVLSPGHSQQFITYPGMNLVSRKERRAMARKPIPVGSEDQYLTGPALMLDILAIFR